MRTIGLLLMAVSQVTAPCLKRCESQIEYAQPDKVGLQTKTYFDSVRGRPQITEIFYPIDPAVPATLKPGIWLRAKEARGVPIAKRPNKLPLILVSHGANGTRIDSAWLPEYLAANGFLVASVEHHGDTWYLQLPDIRVRTAERPLDIAFTLQQLLKDPTFGPRIDRNKIGFIGYSAGGLTGIFLAGGKIGKASYPEPLIKAMILLAPAGGELFEQDDLKKIQIPMGIVVGGADDVTPVRPNAAYYATHIPGAELKILQDAGHFVFLNVASNQGKESLPPRLTTDSGGVQRAKAHEEIGIFTLCFFRCHL